MVTSHQEIAIGELSAQEEIDLDRYLNTRNDGLPSRSSMFQRIQRDGLPNEEHSSVSGRLNSPKLQDDQLDSGLRPLVFHQLKESKDYERKPEASSQNPVFERIKGRNIEAMAKGLKY
ncbi:hypothetical protein ACH5RR_003569 [Cinchona calisaya]|uniref:Uncharacterized protein n=1 Tax=Cinchona calisaya TaxID=153742 RepID=A0ABD3AVD2_9GENT